MGVACMYACVYGYGYMSVCVTRPYMYGSIYVLMDHVPNSSPADLSGYIHVYAHKHTLTHTLTHTHTHTHTAAPWSLSALSSPTPRFAPSSHNPPHPPRPPTHLLPLHISYACTSASLSFLLSPLSLSRSPLSLAPSPPLLQSFPFSPHDTRVSI